MIIAIAGTLALTICVLCLIILHLIPSELNPVRDPVSLYGTTRYHPLYRAQAIASGICALCLLLALIERQPNLTVIGLFMLGCYGCARLTIAAFMMDEHGKRTRTGVFHIILAAIAFTTIAVAAGMLTTSLLASSPWKELSIF